MKILLSRAVLLLCLVLLVSGCVQKRKKSFDASAQFGDQVIAGYNSSGSPMYGGMPAAPAIGQDRKLAWEADLTLEVADASNAVRQVVALTEACGGYVESRSESSWSGTSLRLRLPAAELTNAVSRVEGLGKVTSRRVGNEDVTEQYVDTDARLKNKIVLRDRLRGLLDKATDVKDILAIETELNRVQGDIDSMEALIKSLQGRVDFATLDLTIRQQAPRRILGPLGYVFHGLFWVVEKLFVIRE